MRQVPALLGAALVLLLLLESTSARAGDSARSDGQPPRPGHAFTPPRVVTGPGYGLVVRSFDLPSLTDHIKPPHAGVSRDAHALLCMPYYPWPFGPSPPNAYLRTDGKCAAQLRLYSDVGALVDRFDLGSLPGGVYTLQLWVTGAPVGRSWLALSADGLGGGLVPVYPLQLYGNGDSWIGPSAR